MKRYSKYKDSGVEWLGEIPEHWEVKRLKRYLKQGKAGIKIGPFGSAIKSNIIKSKIELKNQKYKVYGQEQVIGNNFNLGDKYIEQENFEQLSIYQITPGDIVITMMGTTGKAMVVPQGIEIGIMDSHLIRISPIDNEIINKFLALLINNSHYVYTQIKANSKGSIMEGLNSSIIKSLFIIKPPLCEQKTIACFIDRKLVQIDQFISNKQRFIELLKEQKRAIVNRAVTKGLNPNAPMKPSGIEWLGDIPEGWEVKRVKYITQILRGKFTHRPRNDPRMYDGQYPFIQTGDVTSAQKYIKEYHQTLSEEGFAVSKQFPKGTLVMTIAANIGDIAILDFEACFPDSIVGFVPKDFIIIDYLYNLFVAMRQELFRVAPINTQLNLNVDRIGVLWAVVPAIQEQVEIILFIETESAKINLAITKAEKEIELIQEYRTTLISDAVTGKIDVREFTHNLRSPTS